MLFFLCKVLFWGFLQFKGDFVHRKNWPITDDNAPFKKFFKDKIACKADSMHPKPPFAGEKNKMESWKFKTRLYLILKFCLNFPDCMNEPRAFYHIWIKANRFKNGHPFLVQPSVPSRWLTSVNSDIWNRILFRWFANRFGSRYHVILDLYRKAASTNSQPWAIITLSLFLFFFFFWRKRRNGAQHSKLVQAFCSFIQPKLEHWIELIESCSNYWKE